MRLTSLFCVVLMGLLSACQPQQQAANSTSPAKVTVSAVQPPAQFEVRDFTLDEQKDSYGGLTTKGRGTLMAKEPSMAKGAYMVWLSASQEHKRGERWKTLVLVKDGIGTVSTIDYGTVIDKDKKVKYVDWAVIGYVEMKEGSMVGQSVADSQKK